ncbi:hypothetical protein EV401DRAFT_2003987 [Pisolithus croceorrhizus]|nr:hypothetical protein EV401DRAFT_2003987 [Pisolithus croceorrhizus]
MTKGRPQDANPDGQPRNREAVMREIVMTAVATAFEPVTSSLGDLQEQLGPVTTHLQENNRLNPVQETLTSIQPRILDEMGQRFTQLDSTFETLQNQVDMENQHLTELGQSVRATRDVAAVTCKQVGYIADDQNITNKHVTDLVVNSRQIYNSSCRSGFTCSFKVIPFICRDGSLQSPSDLGLPPLLDRGVIDNLTDHQLDQYLEGEHIGCVPAERSDSHATALFFMLAMGCLLYLYLPQLFA